MPFQLVKDLPEEERITKICIFCNSKNDSEMHFGKFYTSESLSAHYYCLLFSSGLEQKGKDDEGILGFLKQDIEKESKRGTKLACSKCRKHGATVGCCNKICKKTYHFPCGVESQMLNQYFGAFNSYCIKHQPVQDIPEESTRNSGMGSKATCTICHEEVQAQANYDVLWAPCCQKQSWFHRFCMQKLALSAGYFFKCPMCSDNTLFLTEMKRMGIYVPEQDASWELEPNAFEELIQRHDKCDHPTCICPKGRNYDGDGTRWELMLCNSCGSKGLHIGCGRLDWNVTEWECEDCSKMGRKEVMRTRSSTESSTPASIARPSLVPTRQALKRPHPADDQSLSSDESDVDITSDFDSCNSFRQHSSSPPSFQCSRNVARRGRGFSSRPSSYKKSDRICTFDNLRFRVSDDSKKIIVIMDHEESPKTYTIPVDQPLISRHNRRK